MFVGDNWVMLMLLFLSMLFLFVYEELLNTYHLDNFALFSVLHYFINKRMKRSACLVRAFVFFSNPKMVISHRKV